MLVGELYVCLILMTLRGCGNESEMTCSSPIPSAPIVTNQGAAKNQDQSSVIPRPCAAAGGVEAQTKKDMESAARDSANPNSG
ncbi:hypothetical protein BC826DRAFT_1000886 [Russula brevipes]|nr:hypothetical protein BC826DRAFT_1000886 [Russula brevipes]